MSALWYKKKEKKAVDCSTAQTLKSALFTAHTEER